jgi:hypothetical protein
VPSLGPACRARLLVTFEPARRLQEGRIVVNAVSPDIMRVGRTRRMPAVLNWLASHVAATLEHATGPNVRLAVAPEFAQ